MLSLHHLDTPMMTNEERDYEAYKALFFEKISKIDTVVKETGAETPDFGDDFFFRGTFLGTSYFCQAILTALDEDRCWVVQMKKSVLGIAEPLTIWTRTIRFNRENPQDGRVSLLIR